MFKYVRIPKQQQQQQQEEERGKRVEEEEDTSVCVCVAWVGVFLAKNSRLGRTPDSFLLPHTDKQAGNGHS